MIKFKHPNFDTVSIQIWGLDINDEKVEYISDKLNCVDVTADKWFGGIIFSVKQSDIDADAIKEIAREEKIKKIKISMHPMVG
jgi:hypothetical protein